MVGQRGEAARRDATTPHSAKLTFYANLINGSLASLKLSGCVKRCTTLVARNWMPHLDVRLSPVTIATTNDSITGSICHLVAMPIDAAGRVTSTSV